MCKYYEETLAHIKEENFKFVEKLKANYQKELDEYRGRYEDLKIKIALDINEKTLHFIKERHGPYYETFCQEKKIEQGAVDSIELLFYICQKQQNDKTWLVDKLAELEELKANLIRENTTLNEALGRLKMESEGCQALVSDIQLQSRFNDHILDQFNRARSELLDALENPKIE